MKYFIMLLVIYFDSYNCLSIIIFLINKYLKARLDRPFLGCVMLVGWCFEALYLWCPGWRKLVSDVTHRGQEGRAVLEECLLITESYKGNEHPELVTHMMNLATSYSQSKNYVEAERLLRRSLRIMIKKMGTDDQSITFPMLHLAVTLYHLKQDEEAEKFALEALRIRKKAFGEDSLPVGKIPSMDFIFLMKYLLWSFIRKGKIIFLSSVLTRYNLVFIVSII